MMMMKNEMMTLSDVRFFHLNTSHAFGETNDSSEPQMRGRDFSGVQLSAMDTAPQHVGEGGGLHGYAGDKHGGPCFIIMGPEIVRPGWCEVGGGL